MSLLPLKTPEELYKEFVNTCYECVHDYRYHEEYVCMQCMKEGQLHVEYAVWKSNAPLCQQFVEPSPIKIAEWIEDYYKSYEEHKKYVL